MTTNGDNFNIASYLPEMARRFPEKRAVVFDKRGTHYTFAELNALSDRYAAGFTRLGLKRGDRVVLMVRPGLDFITVTFALFKAGLVPVLIDPGMGRENLVKCIAEVEPKGFIGVGLAQALRVIYKITGKGSAFNTIKYNITVGRRWFWGGATLTGLAKDYPQEGSAAFCDTKRSDTAAILFTTGSTGIPKGVVYEHGMFDAQVRFIKETYNITEDDVDLPAFPLFALFDTAWGITSVIPDMDPARPAKVDPKKIVRAVKEHGATIAFGSPAIWDHVGRYCLEHSIKLPTLTRILMAGAPVQGSVLERFNDILPPHGDTHTPYGATESLPVTTISGRERLKEPEELVRSGKGLCVGRPVNGMTVKIIRLTDEPIQTWDDALIVEDGVIGEITVRGPVVTRSYLNRDESTRLAKIHDGDTIWHRMGDAGYFDDEGRLMFCGRKAHRVVTKEKTLFSVMCEGVFNNHKDVFRSALVGIGEQRGKQPVIVIEPRAGKMPKSEAGKRRFSEELIDIGSKYDVTRDIKTVLFHPDFPVDIRHNAKIFREKLALWAQTERLTGYK